MKARIRRIFTLLVITIPLSVTAGTARGCGSDGVSGVCCKTCIDREGVW